MKRILSLTLIIIIALSLISCNTSNADKGNQKTPDEDAGMTGYVMKRDQSRILVISQESQDFSATGGVKEFYEAIWFSKAPDHVQVGDKVKVWFDAVAESYPGQSEVKFIEIVPAQQPEGADLNESEALRKAMDYQEIRTSDWVFLKAISYDIKADAWDIKLKEAVSDKLYSLQIHDK